MLSIILLIEMIRVTIKLFLNCDNFTAIMKKNDISYLVTFLLFKI